VSRLGRNSVILLAAALATGLLGWVQLKWLATHLGAAGVGTFAVLFSGGSVLALVQQLGLTLLVTRWVAALEGDGREGPAARVALACLLYSVLAGAALSVAAFLSADAVARAWAPLAGTARVLPWVVTFFSASSARSLLYAVWNGRRRMGRPALVELLQLGTVTVRMYAGPTLTLEDFFRWNACTSLLATVACAALLVPGMWRARGGSFRPGEARELRSYGLWSLLVSGTGMGFDYVDRLVLAARLDPAGVSFFHVPARWLQFVRRLLGQPLNALFPELARGPLTERREAFHAFVEAFSLLGLAAGLALALSPGAFIRLLTSPEFDRGIPVLRTLALVLPLMSLYAPLNTALRAGGSMRQGAVSDLLWVGVYLAFGSLTLARLGSMGLAVGQVLASAAALAWNLKAGRSEDRMGLPWGPLARQWLAALAALGLGWLAPGGAVGWGRAALGCAVFAALARAGLGLSSGARRQITARLPGRLRRPFALLLGA
jgi:O-antigen/teichoic acid export membrane protein